MADLDHSALVRALEIMANHEVQTPSASERGQG
jgi:hypothetical protein